MLMAFGAIDKIRARMAEKAAAQENSAEEGGSIKEKTQNDNDETKVLSDVPSLKEQKAKISLEQNIDRA